MIAEIIKDFDIFLKSDSKLDSTFPNPQFMITDFKVFRYDRNRFGGGLVLFVNDKMQSKFLSKYFIFFETELMAIELHQNKSKWLF